MAWFTTQNVVDQWGENWLRTFSNFTTPPDLAQEKHLHWDTENNRIVEASQYTDGKPNWRIFCVRYTGPFEVTDQLFSPKKINTGVVPWIRTDTYAVRGTPQVAVYAGETLKEFCNTVIMGGGMVFSPVYASDTDEWLPLDQVLEEYSIPRKNDE
jgi:hypothetical protein